MDCFPVDRKRFEVASTPLDIPRPLRMLLFVTPSLFSIAATAVISVFWPAVKRGKWSQGLDGAANQLVSSSPRRPRKKAAPDAERSK